MKENLRKALENRNFKIGDEVPILEHYCPKAGLTGKVIEISSNGIPVTASCAKCGKQVSVDLKTLELRSSR